MTRINALLSIVLFSLSLLSCEEKPFDHFERPDWLNGRVFTIIEEQEDLTTFAAALKRIGYDTIINTAGNYTVFGPSNEAFTAYFQNHPDYNSVEDMDSTELERLVKYHLVQNPWSKLQLRQLDIYGWIDTTDIENNAPRGFKRETLLRDDPKEYGVKFDDENEIIVDANASSLKRMVVSDARKFVPIFFQEYFDIYNLQSSDYAYYFNRPFEGGDAIHFANGKIISDENLAENGFVYVIDEVVEPLNNAYQILEAGGEYSYDKFLRLLNQFPRFSYNEEKTEEQEGLELGLELDSLFDLSFPELMFSINTEKTRPPRGTYGLPNDVTIRHHYGVSAPTNEAMTQFELDYFSIQDGWGSMLAAPRNIQSIVLPSYLCANLIYSSDIENGYYNGEMDLITLDPGTIVDKQFASNSTFFGLDDAIVPRAFSSVAGAVYLNKEYEKIMYLIEESDLLSALKRRNVNYMFFAPSDVNTEYDSSLIYYEKSKRFTTIQREEDGSFEEFVLSNDEERTLILNHTGLNPPVRLARKEYIPTLSGTHIMINNETGEVSGTAPTRDGLNGEIVTSDQFVEFFVNSDNGTAYRINHWFNFSKESIASILYNTNPQSGRYYSNRRFYDLLAKAGITSGNGYELEKTFIIGRELYTVFVPSDAALDAAQVDTLSKNDLRKLLELHFIKGDIIFTDGAKASGYYETKRSKDGSNENVSIYIEPGINTIRFYKPNNELYIEVIEADTITNIIAGRNYDEDDHGRYPRQYTLGVIHEIDKVIMLDSLRNK